MFDKLRKNSCSKSVFAEKESLMKLIVLSQPSHCIDPEIVWIITSSLCTLVLLISSDHVLFLVLRLDSRRSKSKK